MQALPRNAAKWSLKSLSSPTPISSQAAFVCSSCRSLQRQQREQSSAQTQHQRRAFSAHLSLRQTDADTSSPTSSHLPPPPPPPPPSSGHARLTTRRLISISGVDAPHFLHGLITTSIEGANGTSTNGRNSSSPIEQKPWFYCGFLNALGRVLHDVFIYPMPSNAGGDPHYMIEVDAVQQPVLLRHLKHFKLRSKISLRAIDEDEMSVWQVWNDGTSADVGQDASGSIMTRRKEGGSIILPDLRAPDMGYRVLTPGSDHLGLQTSDLPAAFQRAIEENAEEEEPAYRVRRYLRGVPEGSSEIHPSQALPLESNMDVMGGIDFRKGCYVGQELTIRTRHRGVVRKRILPCVLYGGADDRPTALEYKAAVIPSGAGDISGLNIGRLGKKGRSTGTFLAGTGNIGLALCRVQLMSDLVVPNDTATLEFDPAAEFVIQSGKGEEEGEEAVQREPVKVKAFVPDWLRQRLDESAMKHGR
ncbi:Aminomethyltransferase folate-binding domain-containing protein [Xylaria arbuscula]|nr:Aminomethyltransferase folate-binding domain-containing protein [Xylaria arbuscula]